MAETQSEFKQNQLLKTKFSIISKLEKERKTYDINKTVIETKLSSQSILNQVVSKNNKLVNKINLTTEESERKYNNYNEQLEQLYSRRNKEKDTINKQCDYEIKKAEEKRDRLLEKVDSDSNKYETYLIKEKEKLEKKTEMVLTDLSANIIDPSNTLDEDKYPILTKSKEIIKQLEEELEIVEKEYSANEIVRMKEMEKKNKDREEMAKIQIQQEELKAQREKQRQIEEHYQKVEAIKKQEEERQEKRKLEKIKVLEEQGDYISKEEQDKIDKENIKAWKKNILSQLPPDYITVAKRCDPDRQKVCYKMSDPIELKNYLDNFKSRVEKMIILDDICHSETNTEYFNDINVWDIWKRLPISIQMTIADLDTKEKQLKLIKSSKSMII